MRRNAHKAGFRPVGQGLAACDGFAGLRAVCARPGTGGRRTREGRAAEMAAAGRCEATAFVTDSGSITRILAYLGEPAQAPHVAPTARGPTWEEDVEPCQDTDLSERAASESRGQGLALRGARRTQRQDIAGQIQGWMLRTPARG